jgi:phenylpyruvate tautomerase PptA (4-oxalocrotonate tautomerase family)
MPIVRIDVTGPKSADYKKALLTGARRAVVEALGVGDERVTVRVIETPAEWVDVPPCRTERFTVVEVLLYEGRTEELKRGLVKSLRDAFAADPGIEECEVSVFVNDASPLDLDVLPGSAPSAD